MTKIQIDVVKDGKAQNTFFRESSLDIQPLVRGDWIFLDKENLEGEYRVLNVSRKIGFMHVIVEKGIT